MAVAFDNANSVQGVTVANLTTSAWTIAGADRLLVAGMGWASTAPPSYSEMRWEGSGGTLLTQVGSTLSFGVGRTAMARLITPNAASGTLYGALSGVTDEFCIGGVSFTGANQTVPLGTAVTNTATAQGSPATASAASIGSAADEIVVDMAFGIATNATSSAATVAVGAGQQMRWEQENIANFDAGTQSTEPGAASITMTEVFTITGDTVDWGIIGVSIKSSNLVSRGQARFRSMGSVLRI